MAGLLRRRGQRPALFTVSLFGALFAAACQDGGDEAALTELESIDADQIVYGATRTISEQGVRSALLNADSMFVWEDSAFVRINGLFLTVYDEDGRRRANITAEWGKLTESTDELTAYGNVVLSIPADDKEIRSQELHFASETERVWTDSAVVIREGNCEYEGERMQADMDFDDVRIWGTRGEACPPS